MLHQIVYDEGSAIFQYLSSNDMVEGEEAYTAANSLLEEIEQGNTPVQCDQSEKCVDYNEYFTEVSWLPILNLLFGRRLAMDYTFRTLSADRYFKQKLIVLAGAITIFLCLWVFQLGIKILLISVCALGYLLYSRLKGDRIIIFISEAQRPNAQFLEAFNAAFKLIKEAEFVERGLNNSETHFQELLLTHTPRELSTYTNLWIEQRWALAVELRHVSDELLRVLQQVATAHSEFLAKYAVLREKTNLLPRNSLTLDTLKKLMEVVYQLHRQIREVAVVLLLNPKVNDLHAYAFVSSAYRVDRLEEQAAVSVSVSLKSREHQAEELLDKHRVFEPTSNVVYCIERLNYVKQLLEAVLCSSTDNLSAPQRLYDKSLIEIKYLWRLLHQLKQKSKPKQGPLPESASEQLIEILPGGVAEPQHQHFQERDYELVMTEAGQEIHFKNREMSRIADQLETLFLRKEKGPRTRKVEASVDQRIRFNFITELKRETEGLVLE